MNILIGVVASAIILFQTQYVATSFVWALIHGAGISSFFASWPVALALLILWGGWFFIKHKVNKHRVVFSLIFSIVVIVVLEVMMPITPLRTYLQQQAINTVRVENVSDEVLLTENGNPIGIRLVYDVTFPRDGIYSISPSQYSPLNDTSKLYPLQFGHFLNTSVEPEPSRVDDLPGMRSYKANIQYHFIYDSAPNFLHYNNSNKYYCLYFQPNTNYTDSDVIQAITNSDKMQYRTYIQTDGETSFTNGAVTSEYITKNSYSLKEIYNDSVREGIKTCQF